MISPTSFSAKSNMNSADLTAFGIIGIDEAKRYLALKCRELPREPLKGTS